MRRIVLSIVLLCIVANAIPVIADEPEISVEVTYPKIVYSGESFDVIVETSVLNDDLNSIDVDIDVISDYQNPIQVLSYVSYRDGVVDTQIFSVRGCLIQNSTVIRIEINAENNDGEDVDKIEFITIDFISPIETVHITETEYIASTTITNTLTTVLWEKTTFTINEFDEPPIVLVAMLFLIIGMLFLGVILGWKK